MKLREELTVLVRLDSNNLTSSYYIQNNGKYDSDYTIDCSSFVSTAASISKLDQLETRIEILENLLKQKQNTDDKYKIVYGEH